MQTTAEGEGTVTFDWKVRSEEGDYLEFRIDGQFKGDIEGEGGDWENKSVPVTGQGTHTLKWRFYTDDEGENDGCGWVDNVQWSGSPEPVPDPPKWDTITYKYDHSGRRIEKSGNGEAIKYCYDGGHVIAEYDGNDRLLRKYIYGARVDEPVCMIEVVDSNAVYYYHFDGLGSVVALSDSEGDSVQSYEYTIYGQVAAEDPDHPNPYMFTGRRFDIETGLYHYRARCYNPHIGRFMQTDPVGYADGINWYLYCKNNPVNFGDPSGKWYAHSVHFKNTERMMLMCGFSAADAERTASANRAVDINIFRPFGSPAGAHYMKGEQVAAEKRIRDLMFTAVKEANKGNNTGALKSLGRALHTLQDKHAHYLQGIGNRDEHSKKDADNPLVNHRAWNEAWNDSMELIKMFKKLTSGGPDAADAADDYFEDYDDYIRDLEEAEEAEREAEEEWHRNL